VSDVLSAEQIAALVDAAREGTLPDPAVQAAPRRQRRVREVDFTRPTKFTQEQQRRVSRHHQSFCRTAQTQLTAEFRTTVELEVLNVDQQAWVSALQEVPQPSIYAFVTTSAGAPLLLSLEQGALMTMIEWLLGGPAETRPVDRDLTDVELALTHRIFATLVSQLSRTWQDLLETELALGGIETQQANIQLVAQSEPTLAITMELQLGRLSSTMTLLVPHRSIEALLGNLSKSNYGDAYEPVPTEDGELRVRNALRSIPVEVRAEVGSRELSVDEVLALRPGDVLRLGPSAAGGLLYASAVPTHRIRPGRSGRRRAVAVLDRLEP
jgi:flagellar motor switch protein FliM